MAKSGARQFFCTSTTPQPEALFAQEQVLCAVHVLVYNFAPARKKRVSTGKNRLDGAWKAVGRTAIVGWRLEGSWKVLGWLLDG
jgi:hypothetical protein